MATKIPSLQDLWRISNFKPNKSQEEAILHTKGPLFLTAGPGSGKTRVLLWRTVNLIVFNEVKPEEIFLSTFTEKAAHQLREGLKTLLAIVTNETGRPYDLANMAVGTVHSLCQRMLSDRRFSPEGKRPRSPELMDELAQYFHLYRRSKWNELLAAGGYDLELGNKLVNAFLDDKTFDKASGSRHEAVLNTIALFNRFSEECIEPVEAKKKTRDADAQKMLDMYAHYKKTLDEVRPFGEVDFSLLQQKALALLNSNHLSESVFKYVIIDEYQDTNYVQEQIFFKLAAQSKNICVVGDDDQALYRFRGATVENLVQFEDRCQQYLDVKPKRIDLDINYRSRSHIVTHYTDFINRCDWQRRDKKGYHRIHDKKIKADSTDEMPCVIASDPGEPADVYKEVVGLVKKLIKEKKVQDPNQIAFLFPALKGNSKAEGFKAALEDAGLKVYAPRAGRFLDLDEAKAVFGLFLFIFGQPKAEGDFGQGIRNFHGWLSQCKEFAKAILDNDKNLKEFIGDKQNQLEVITNDYKLLLRTTSRMKWTLDMPFNLEMRRKLAESAGLSEKAKRSLTSTHFQRVIEERIATGKPFTLGYIINRTTALDWSVLDLFYQLNGFKYFREFYELAEQKKDEGPMCNLGIVSQYLGRYMEQFATMITASYLEDEKFQRQFFLSYLYALYRRQESEFEDEDDPFPKGRIPFLTIHQAKGLEFPVVVLGNPRKRSWPASKVEILARKLTGKDGEPIERIGEFDNMRMFYVALSRPKNLLVIPHFKGRGQSTYPAIEAMLDDKITRIPKFDTSQLPEAKEDEADLGKNYSYTGDYLLYQKCPRQYMVFKKYGFVPSRSQTMFFGSLVHQTIEDLHHFFIQARNANTTH
jgi:DNA helicase-2/ATP-dependent DNA helicase PcrA